MRYCHAGLRVSVLMVSRALRSLRRSRSVDFDEPTEPDALTGHPEHGGTELSGWENPHYRRSGRSPRDTINTEARRASEDRGGGKGSRDRGARDHGKKSTRRHGGDGNIKEGKKEVEMGWRGITRHQQNRDTEAQG